MDTLFDTARLWFDRGHEVALATVVRTWGSSPRPVGSHLLIRDDGLFEGSVSGGCIEGDVVTHAMDIIADGAPRLIRYGVSQEKVWEIGLTCGGTVHVYIEKLDRTEFLAGLGNPDRVRGLLARVLDLKTHQTGYVDMDTTDARLDLTAEHLSAIRQMMRTGVSAGLDHADKRIPPDVFVCTYGPAWRLVAVGAVHITQALTPMAAQAGFDVTVIDPRGAFGARERFQDVTLIGEWPDEAFAHVPLDARTAVVMLTHDEKLDDPALFHALQSHAFYIGALGSRKTQAARNTRLMEMGLPEAALARIHGPVGLNIGAKTAAEIAVSILAEIIATRRQGGQPVSPSMGLSATP